MSCPRSGFRWTNAASPPEPKRSSQHSSKNWPPIRGIVTQTGCAGHCKDEPTVEITLPGRRPVLYGHVTAERVAELVERQIVRGETAEGLIEA